MFMPVANYFMRSKLFETLFYISILYIYIYIYIYIYMYVCNVN